MLTSNQIKKFEEKLFVIQKDLEAQIQELEKEVDFGSDIDHFEEEADETEETGNRLALKFELEKKLERVEKALRKIKKNNYGFCENCHQEIDEETLEIAPESEFCRQCKIKLA